MNDKNALKNPKRDTRITVLLSIDRMIIGGAEQQFLELVKGLDKTRFNVIVVTVYAGGDLEAETKNVPGIEYICLNRRGKLDFSPLTEMYGLLKRKKVDVVQPFLTPATFFTLLPAIFRRTPVKVVTERGGLRRKQGFGYNLYLRSEDWLTHFAERVIPNSNAGKTFLVSRGIKPEDIRVIYNGINLRRLNADGTKAAGIRAEMNLGPGGRVVGISSSLTPTKDHDTFLRAARLIADELPQVKFALLGDGPLRPALEKLAGDLGLGDKVIFWGNQTDVSPYIVNFDVACLSSSQGEGCSNAVLEAMALGKPVVVTDTGGNRELVEHGKTGLVVPVRNPRALADAVLTVLKQPETAAAYSRRAREVFTERFSLERMVRDYETLYEEALQEKGRG